jgi:hypothetical protein
VTTVQFADNGASLGGAAIIPSLPRCHDLLGMAGGTEKGLANAWSRNKIIL